MTVRQLTLLTGNSASHLSDVLANLSNQGVDIRAHCLVDNGDGHCKLRMVVSDPAKGQAIFQDINIAAVVNDVVILETDDKPGGLSRTAWLVPGGRPSGGIHVHRGEPPAGHGGDGVPVFRQRPGCSSSRTDTASNCSMPEPVAPDGPPNRRQFPTHFS